MPLNALTSSTTDFALWSHKTNLDVISVFAKGLHFHLPSSPDRLTGRRMPHLSNWKNLTTDQSVLKVILSYQMKLKSSLFLPLWDRQQISKAKVQYSLVNGAMSNQRADGLFSRNLLVPKKDGSFKAVVNLCPLNTCMLYRQMEGIHIVREDAYLQSSCFQHLWVRWV